MTGALGPWTLLALAMALEIAGTMLLKLSDGFVKWHWGVCAILLYAVCFVAMAGALRSLPVGIVYAVWAGVGIAAVTVLGFLAFGERLSASQLFFILLILAGAIGLRITGSDTA